MLIAIIAPCVNAMIPASDIAPRQLYTITDFTEKGISYVPSAADHHEIVPGIGGKDSSDNSVKLYSRVTDSTNPDNFRVDIDLFSISGISGTCFSAYTEGTVTYKYLNSDVAYEFNIMPNDKLSYVRIGDRGNTYADIYGLDTTKWNNVKVIIDADKYTAYVFVNGTYYAQKTGIKPYSGTNSTLQFIRIHGRIDISDDNDDQKEVLEDTDIYYYFDDFKFYSVTADVPSVIASQTTHSEFTWIKSGRMSSSGGGSNSSASGVFGRDVSDESFKAVMAKDYNGTTAWYGFATADAGILTDADTTKDTVYELSIAVPEQTLTIKVSDGSNNFINISSFRKDQWIKMKAVYNYTDKTYKIYINGVYYADKKVSSDPSKFRVSVDTPSDVESTMYLDNIKIYQTAQGVEAFDEATSLLPETYTLENNETVGEVKRKLNISSTDNVKVYSDNTYTGVLSDNDSVINGSVIVTRNSNDVFQYCTLIQATPGLITFTGSAKYSDSQFKRGTLKASTYTDTDANLYIAQFDKNNELIGISISETGSGNISTEYTVLETDGYIKTFLWSPDYMPLADPITLTYKNAVNVLIVGNSFSRDSLFYTREIAAEKDIDVTMGLLYFGGRDFTYHYDTREESVNSLYINNFGGGAVNNAISLKTVLTDPTYKWDVVILQNYFGVIYTSISDSKWLPVGADLAEYVHGLVPDAEIMLNAVWSFEEGYSYGSTGITKQLQAETDEYIYTKNLETAEAIKDRIGVDVKVVPVGTAIANARNYTDEEGIDIFGGSYYLAGVKTVADAYPDGKGYDYGYGILSPEDSAAGKVKLNRDGFHLTPLGRYIASAVWYEVLTGESITDTSYVPPEDTNVACLVKDTDGNSFYLYGTYCSPDAEYINILKQIVHNLEK